VQDANLEHLVYGDMTLGDMALNRAIMECVVVLMRAASTRNTQR
jgi:hypothetical protein